MKFLNGLSFHCSFSSVFMYLHSFLGVSINQSHRAEFLSLKRVRQIRMPLCTEKARAAVYSFGMPLCTEKQARAAVYYFNPQNASWNIRVLHTVQCMLVNQLSLAFHNGEG